MAQSPKAGRVPVSAPHVLSVSELTARIKGTLETSFAGVWVAGEITDFSRPRSGHIYLTLKDGQAQLRAVIWRGTAEKLRFDLADGLEVLCHGDIDVYPPRGSYQLVIRQLEPRGEGALQLALRQLQAKLAAEGLFDAPKKPLPPLPTRVAIVTSPTAAALRDFLQVAGRRWRGVALTLIPASVQGDCAAGEIVEGIKAAERLRPRPDVLVVTRGGGSLEDLWCFNDERVVRAIHGCQLPVVSAIGHEIDVTLSDYVADVRAATPTEAAERVVPDAAHIGQRLEWLRRHLAGGLARQASNARLRVESLAGHNMFARPFEPVRLRAQQLDELEQRMGRAAWHEWRKRVQAIGTLAARLESLSPLGVLARGYSLTRKDGDGELITDAKQLQAGDCVHTQLARGEIICRVEEIHSRK